MDIEQLEQEEKRILAELQANRSQQRELHTAAFIQKYGVNIGAVVEWVDAINKRKGMVFKLEYSGVKPCYIWCNVFNSDDKPGKREMKIWNYSMSTLVVVEPAPPTGAQTTEG
jgi:hypothetical protein